MSAYPDTVGGVAILDAETAFAEGLAALLRERGSAVCVLAAIDVEGDAAWLERADVDALVIDPAISMRRCLRLLATLRGHGGPGVLALTRSLTAALVADLAQAGATLVLEKPLPLHQAIQAIELIREPGRARDARHPVWTLARGRRLLIAPGGKAIPVSDADRRLLECFAHASGSVVERDRLKRVVGSGQEVDLNACVYRMRRRIASVAGTPLPLRAKSGDGYVFSGRIELD